MRIVSKFKDYYDVNLAYGQDDNLRYIRHPNVVELKEFDDCHPLINKLPSYNTMSGKFSCRSLIVGFCGKIYPILSLNESSSNWNYNFFDKNIVKCYNIEDIDNYFLPKLNEHQIELYHCSSYKEWCYKQRTKAYRNAFSAEHSREKFAKFFENIKKVENNFAELFIEFKSPIFTYEYRPRFNVGRRVTFNACLRETGFVKIFPPVQALQELSMYMGSIAAPEKIIPHVDDKTLAEAKGFDKFSFRKDPSKKKRK